MLNLLIALAVGALVTVLIKLLGFSIWAGVVPGVLALVGSYIFLARRIALKVQALSKAAEKELSAQPTSQRERQQRVEKAIKRRGWSTIDGSSSSARRSTRRSA
jgi:hypothetical protein